MLSISVNTGFATDSMSRAAAAYHNGWSKTLEALQCLRDGDAQLNEKKCSLTVPAFVEQSASKLVHSFAKVRE